MTQRWQVNETLTSNEKTCLVFPPIRPSDKSQNVLSAQRLGDGAEKFVAEMMNR